jgi:hypothetical protein
VTSQLAQATGGIINDDTALVELYEPNIEVTLQGDLVKGEDTSGRKLQLPFFSQHSSSNTTETQSLTQSPPLANDSEALLQTTPDFECLPAS